MLKRSVLLASLYCILAIGCVVTQSACSVSGIAVSTPTDVTATAYVTPFPTATSTLRPSPTVTATCPPSPTPGPAPELIASYPIQGDQAVRRHLPLVLIFDQPINAHKAQIAFQPPIEGALSNADSHTLSFAPSADWPNGDITCTLTGLRGTANTLPADLTLSFSCEGYGAPVPALMYHHLETISADAPQWQRDWSVSPQAFTEQMTYLVEHGYESVSPDQLAAYFQGKPLPQNPIIITMDDGYRDVYTVAWPILKDTELRPVLYISPEYIECSAYLTHLQIEELLSAGCIVGVHGYDHSSLPEQSETGLYHQIVDARDVLQEMSQDPIHTFCYPYGAYNTNTLSALASNGYSTAFTLNHWLSQPYDEPFKLNRLRVDYDTALADFAAMLVPR